MKKVKIVTTLLGNLKGPVELGNSNTCAKVKLCLFLFTSALEIVCSRLEFFLRVHMDSLKSSLYR